MASKFNLPDDIERLKADVFKIMHPVCSVIEKKTKAEKNFLHTAQRTDAGRELPPYYLCYFLLVDLMGFKNLGQFEKISWSVPIDYKGTAYLIEHRKLGLGLFAADKESQEEEAKEIVKLISKSIKLAQPYFKWRAEEAAKKSDLNVLNHSRRLFDRYSYFLGEYKDKAQEAEQRSDERVVTNYDHGGKSISYPEFKIRRNSEWLAISAIDAFFSWTEHIFIHAAVLKGSITTGEDVANLADNEWAIKFKAALDTNDPKIRVCYDQLVVIKRQIRNYLAHGAFGKRGEAFKIHSGAGAVPLLMPHNKNGERFSFQSDLGFDEAETIKVIEGFIAMYWESDSLPEVVYIKSDMPTILPYATDGTYRAAMQSKEEMDQFLEHLMAEHDRAANMDW